MVKGKSYSWNNIVKFGIEGGYSRTEFGSYVVGKSIIVLESDLHTLTFVLTGVTGQESIYECVYVD
jgi:hypothetical protein